MNGKARGIKIIIGKRVHIGAGCVISPSEEHVQDGVLEIGDGAFIQAGSTVVKVCLPSLADVMPLIPPLPMI